MRNVPRWKTICRGVTYELIGYVKDVTDGIKIIVNDDPLNSGEYKDALESIAYFHNIDLTSVGSSTHSIFGEVVKAPNVRRIA